MADLSDVNNALVATISQILYPNGVNRPSIVQTDVKVYVGWPLPAQLDADLSQGIAQVSVYPRPEEHNTTRFPLEWQELSVAMPTLTLTTAGQTVTVGGAVSVPQNLCVFVNAFPYVYAVLPTDSLNSIAQALAALIPGAFAQDSTITVQGRLGAARVGITGTAMEEVRRQEKLFQIGVWAPTPVVRDTLASAIDAQLAATEWLTFTDTTQGRLIYRNSVQSDQLQRQQCYRRDLFYTVEYGTTITETDTQITQTVLNVSAEVASVAPPMPVATVYE